LIQKPLFHLILQLYRQEKHILEDMTITQSIQNKKAHKE